MTTSIWKEKPSKWKEGPYAFIAVIIIVMSIVFLIAYIVPYFQPITYMNKYYYYDYDEETDDRTYYYDLMEYTDRIYVHKDGDNTTGESWETAYTTINGAYIETSADLDDNTIIFAGLGIFDVNIAGQLDINKNIHIVGSGRHGTIFMNSHASADYVFNVTEYFKMEHSAIFYNQSYGGINVWGNNSDVYLKHMKFYTEAGRNGSSVSLQLNSGGYGEFKNIYFYGGNKTSVAINVSESLYNHFEDIEIYKYGVGINLIGIDSRNNIFENIRILENTLGLNINNGTVQFFYNVEFFGCTVNISGEVGNSYWN